MAESHVSPCYHQQENHSLYIYTHIYAGTIIQSLSSQAAITSIIMLLHGEAERAAVSCPLLYIATGIQLVANFICICRSTDDLALAPNLHLSVPLGLLQSLGNRARSSSLNY